MSGWTVQDIRTEVSEVSSLMVARAPPPGSWEAAVESYNRLQSSLVASLCNKIAGILVLSAGGALELMQSVVEATLPETAKGDIQAALDSKLNASSQSSAPRAFGGHRRPQQLLFPANYLTAQDWDELMAPDAGLFRLTMIVVQRYKRLGVKSLHEQTVKWAVAMLVCLWTDRAGKLPSYSQIFELVKDFKKAWETGLSDISHVGLQTLYEFPEHTADLPDGFVEKAYGSDEPIV